MTTFLVAVGLLLGSFNSTEVKYVQDLKKKLVRMEYVSPADVKILKERIRRRFDRRELPYRLVKNITAKISYSHVNSLMRNWYALPADARQKIILNFEEAGIGNLIFLCFYESAADPWDVSWAEAISLYQITPRTAEFHCGVDEEAFESLYDPVDNSSCAVQILLDKGVKKDLVWGLLKYNGIRKACTGKGGYMACLEKTYKEYCDLEKERKLTKKEARLKRRYYNALMYVPNVLLHLAIGEELIYKSGRLAQN